jgi:hypothetical protein
MNQSHDHRFHDFDKPIAWLAKPVRYLRPGATVATIGRDPAGGARSSTN